MKKQLENGKVIGEFGLTTGLKISVNLPVIVFEEEKYTVFYCPALDITSYGDNEDLAFKSFKISLEEYFLYTTQKKSLREDLKQHGWVVPKSKKKPMTPPNMSELLRDNDILIDVVDNKSYRKLYMPIEIPAFA